MPSQPIDRGWGFNAVIDLIESDYDVASPTLSTASTIKPHDAAPQLKFDNETVVQSPFNIQPSLRLGDFSKLFGELGIALPDPPIAPASPVDSEGPLSSDDALLNDHLGASSPEECADPDSPLAGMTAKQQKKARKKAAKKDRKVRKAQEALAGAKQPFNDIQLPRTRSNVGAKIRPASPTPNEVQPGLQKQQPPVRILQYTHDRPGSVSVDISAQHFDSLPRPSSPILGPYSATRKHDISIPNGVHSAQQSEQVAQPSTTGLEQPLQTNFLQSSYNGANNPQVKQILQRPAMPAAKPSNGLQPRVPPSVRLNHDLVPRTVQPMVTPRIHNLGAVQAYGTPMPQPMLAPVYQPVSLGQNSASMAHVQPAPGPVAMNQTPYQILSPNRFATPVQLPVIPGGTTRSLTIRPTSDRHVHFFNKLLANFPEDAPGLVSPMSLTNQDISAQGIHCFVDASNIMIGFKDMLRRHGQYNLEMSFDTLALLMERRRPVAKRINAGSHREAAPDARTTKLVEVSKAVGYENLVKEQVYIVREDSDRKKFFKDVERVGWIKATQMRTGSGSDSETGPAAPTPPPAPKWVEQGVDEILHLKMCQSIIDAEPSTMVLATGDGNTAEFSDGFLANVERALKKGWTVELVSWKQQMSAGYRNKKFRAKWGEKFKVIELDDYLESLIDT